MAISITSILSTARSGLLASQSAISVTAQNISNASTEGYSRKRVEQATGPSVMYPFGAVGTGVAINDISRVRDSLLDVAYRAQSSGASGAGRRSELLGQVEALFNEPGDSSLGAALDAFWNAWSDLATEPGDLTVRGVVRDTANAVIFQFSRIADGIARSAETAAIRMSTEIDEVNRLTADVARLNVRIVADESGGATSGELRDQRDQIIDAIARILPVQVTERPTGAVAINVDGINIVDGADAVAIRLDSAGGTYRLLSERGSAITLSAGSLAETMRALNVDLPAVRADLDQLAQGLVAAVNAIHRTGTGPDGVTGVPFFDDFGDASLVKATNMTLSAPVKASVRAIAAGTGVLDGGGTTVYAAGRNDVASLIGALRDGAVASLGGASAGAFYDSAVARLGQKVRAADDDAVLHQTLASQALTRRESVSGVSIDEELVALVRYQTAYTAATKVITAVDEMMDSLLAMKR